ncbi:MAG: SH3 domain-containing protein [bacterium]|nr:SH3 domain-containing protein [bacterium]
MGFFSTKKVGIVIQPHEVTVAYAIDDGVMHTGYSRIPVGAIEGGMPQKTEVVSACIRRALDTAVILARVATVVVPQQCHDFNTWRAVFRDLRIDIDSFQSAFSGYVTDIQQGITHDEHIVVALCEPARTYIGVVSGNGLMHMHVHSVGSDALIDDITSRRNCTQKEARAQLKKKDIFTGRTIERNAIARYLGGVADAITATPLSVDGIVYVGELSHIRGSSEYLSRKTRLACTKVPNPLYSCARGIAVRSIHSNEYVAQARAWMQVAIAHDTLPTLGTALAMMLVIVVGSRIVVQIHGERRVAQYEADVTEARLALEQRVGTNLDEIVVAVIAHESDRRLRASEDGVIIGPTPTGWVHVRTGPGTNYTVIKRVDEGEVYRLRGSRFGWLNITLSDGTDGWVYGEYTSRNI